MVEAVGEQGYAATTVADVIERAGVSRKAFYEHFPNKQDCFLKAFDQVITTGLARAEDAYREASGGQEGIKAALTMLFEHAAANPRAVRLVLTEVGAVGPEGVARREQHMAAYEALLAHHLSAAARSRNPDPILRALVGGLGDVLFELVQRPRRPERHAVVADLAAWMSSYRPIPPALMSAKKADLQTRVGAGGRAPGTLSPQTQSSGRRGLRGERSSSHSYVVHNQRERILDAAANLSAAKGFAAVTVREIADGAAVSLDAFYEHFIDKEDAFLVAYEVGHHKSLAVVERAFSEAPDWPRGIQAAVGALFDFLACEPAFAHLALADALVASPRTAERARKGASAYRHMLARGLEETSSEPPPSITIAAIAGGIFELCSTCVTQKRLETLPEAVGEATYFALAPFIGNVEAARIATGEDAAPTSTRRV